MELEKAEHLNIETEFSTDVLDVMIDFLHYLAPELQTKVKVREAPSKLEEEKDLTSSFLNYLLLGAIQNDPIKVVGDWLKGIGLPQYTQAFLQNGFFDLAYIKTLEPVDLELIGISDDHKEILLAASKKLGEQPNVEEVLSTGEKEKMDQMDLICAEFANVRKKISYFRIEQ